MAFDYTNYLENTTDVNNDFVFTNRAGTVDSGLQPSGNNGNWCLGNNTTPSGSTGPAANPSGRSGFVYTEASSPAASNNWAMRRNTSFNSTTQNVFLDLIYCLNALADSEFYVEYATVASPNETTDWTILETIPCWGAGNANQSWVPDTFDFSGISSATLWLRVRCNTSNNYQNDLAFSTWREYGVDTTTYTLSGVTKDNNGTPLGNCECFLFKDNQDNTLTYVAHTQSDNNGNYSFSAGIGDNDAQYLVYSFKDDTPHVMDVTDHVLQPVEE